MIVERQHPRCRDGNLITVTLGLQNSGKLDFVGQIFAEPFFADASILPIQRETPFTCELLRLESERLRSTAEDKEENDFHVHGSDGNLATSSVKCGLKMTEIDQRHKEIPAASHRQFG